MAEGKKFPRRFKERWATYPKCEHIIQEVWIREAPRGSPMFRIFSKIGLSSMESKYRELYILACRKRKDARATYGNE